MRPLLSSALVIVGCTAGAALLAGKTCNPYWFTSAGALIVIVGVLLQTWEYITTPNADSMKFYKTNEEHERVRAAMFAFVAGTALQGFGDWVWAAIRPFSHCS